MLCKQCSSEKWYHGTNHGITQFHVEGIGNGLDEFGPGIYFSNFPEVSGAYGSNLYEVTTDPLKLVSAKSGRVSKAQVLKLITMAPGYKDALENWDYRPQIALTEAVEGCMGEETPWDVFTQVWYEFYKYNAPQWAKNMVKLGYDGCIYDRFGGTQFLILLNPVKIKTMQKVDKVTT